MWCEGFWAVGQGGVGRRDKSSRSNRCYLSTTVGLISQNNLRMVTAVTVDIKSRCQQLFITKKIMKAKS